MKPLSLFVLSILACGAALFTIVFFMQGETVSVLMPRGLVAEKELALMIDVVSLMLITATAVFALTFFFAWRYRASNTKAVYLPNWEHGAMSELVWWAIPIEIVLILGALTWTSTHDLDPHKALEGGIPPLTVEVVALEWKWLFIYPEQRIATMNEVRFPVDQPVRFIITADAPMNSFWIPQLGGQIYAMTGMATEINLMADTPGTYAGSSANYSGEGFAHMKFDAVAMTSSDFESWVALVRQSPDALTLDAYNALSEPSGDHPQTYYTNPADNLFNSIMMKFMSPLSPSHTHAR